MITKAKDKGFDRNSIKILMNTFNLGIVEKIPEVFAKNMGKMGEYWDVLLTYYYDAFAFIGVRDILGGDKDPRSGPYFPTDHLSELPEEILMDKEKLGAVLEITVKYPVHAKLGPLFWNFFFSMVNYIPKGVLADDSKYFRVFRFIKMMFEQGEDVSGIIMADRSQEIKDMALVDPSGTIGYCISMSIVSLGIMFRYAGEKLLKETNFSRFFDMTDKERIDTRIKVLSKIVELAKMKEWDDWKTQLATIDPNTYKSKNMPRNILLQAFIDKLFPDED